MSKKIITIGRQTGSGGHEIGERLAKRLNIPFYDRNLVEKAVEELKLDKEDMQDIDEKLLSNIAMSCPHMFSTDRPYHMAEYSGSLSDQIYKAQTQIIKQLAEQGPCVIVGRCADYVLRNRDDVLSVFICAGKEERIQRMMKIREVNREHAEHLVRVTDKDRRTYYNTYTGREWDSLEAHHMILNSGLLGIDTIVNMLAEMYEA